MIVAGWEYGKDVLRHLTRLDDPVLHVHIGLALWLAAALVLRRPLSSPVPLAIVAAVELLNELCDRLHYGSWRLPDTIGDIANSLVWPIVFASLLSIVARLRYRAA